MAVSLVGVTAPAAEAYGFDTVVAVPAGVAEGDLLLAVVRLRQPNSVITPAEAGWTELHQVAAAGGTGTSTIRMAVYVRTATASEPASYLFNSDAAYRQGGMLAYRGADVAASAATSADFPGSAEHTPTSVELPDAVSGAVVLQAAMCGYDPSAPAWNFAGGTQVWDDRRFTAVEWSGVSASAGSYDPPSLSHDGSAHALAAAAVVIAPGATPTPTVAGGLAGAGDLSAATTAIHAASASLAGGGTLSAAVESSEPVWVDANLAGFGTWAATVEVATTPATTDTSNRLGGLSLGGYGIASWSPAVVPPPVGGGHAVVSAQAFGPVTMRGAQPVYTISEASKTRDRHRILVGGVDVTFFRDTPTPAPSYQLGEPLLWGRATAVFPQIAATKERFGVGDLSWLYEQAPVVLQRVDAAGNVTATDYRGFVTRLSAAGAELRVELGGDAHGRASLQNRQVPIFQFVRDIGWYAYWAVKGALNRAFEPALGPTTGIELGRLAGGQTQLDYIRELCAQAQTKSGKRWTIMPDDRGVYSMFEKDTTTIHATAFDDDARIVVELLDDLAEKPNRIYVTGVTPAGQRVRFGAYPGLIHGKAPNYPFNDNRTFGAGTTDADTDTGDGVTVLAARLRHTGFLSADDSPGGYDDDVTRGVKALQRRAELDVTGDVNVNTWEAAFDLNVTGYRLTGSQVEPAAQGRATKKWLRSASGAIIGRNPHYKPGRVAVDRNIDLGSSGFKRGLMRDFAEEELQEARTSNWHGTVTITTGAVLAGEVAEGATITAADVMDARDLRPGMNLWLPQFDGGTLVHISGVDVSGDGEVTLTVDSRARDALEVWQVIERNRETRNNPARSWAAYRSSQETKDSIGIWDEVGGLLSGNVDLEPGWNVLPIVAGQAGSVAKLRLELKDAAEFACAVFGAKTGAGRLNHLISDPLTKAGTEAWEKRHIRKVLDDHILLYSAGTKDEPCGYSPGRKQNDEGNRSNHPLRGVHRDEASFSYLTAPGRPVLYLAVYVREANVLKRGRVMWPQLEAAV